MRPSHLAGTAQRRLRNTWSVFGCCDPLKHFYWWCLSEASAVMFTITHNFMQLFMAMCHCSHLVNLRNALFWMRMLIRHCTRRKTTHVLRLPNLELFQICPQTELDSCLSLLVCSSNCSLCSNVGVIIAGGVGSGSSCCCWEQRLWSWSRVNRERSEVIICLLYTVIIVIVDIIIKFSLLKAFRTLLFTLKAPLWRIFQIRC